MAYIHSTALQSAKSMRKKYSVEEIKNYLKSLKLTQGDFKITEFDRKDFDARCMPGTVFSQKKYPSNSTIKEYCNEMGLILKGPFGDFERYFIENKGGHILAIMEKGQKKASLLSSDSNLFQSMGTKLLGLKA